MKKKNSSTPDFFLEHFRGIKLEHFWGHHIHDIPMGIFFTDLQAKIIYINKYMEQLTGQSSGDLLGEDADTLFHDSNQVREITGRVSKAGFSIGEYHTKTIENQDVWMRVLNFLVHDDHGKPIGICCIAFDFPECKKIAEDLKTSEYRYRTTIDAIDDMIHLIDDKFDIILHNQTLKQLLPAKLRHRDNLHGVNLFDVFPFLSEKIRDQYLAVFNSGEPLITEDAHTFEGRLIWMETRKFPIKNKLGQTDHVLTIVHDISRRVDYERELMRTSEELQTRVSERKMELSKVIQALEIEIAHRERAEKALTKIQRLESIGILAGGIAHDFNNILMAITGYLTAAKWQAKQYPSIHEMIEKTEKALIQARHLAQQFMTHTKGNDPLKSILDLEDSIHEAVTFALRGSPIKATYQIQEDLWKINADPGQINQVIHNIIINAQQSMKNEGHLIISAENIRIHENSDIPCQPGSYVKLTFQDDGPGISREIISKIFDPYFTTKSKGSGLGLASSANIIRNHNGHIRAQSESPDGATFEVILPATLAKSEQKKSQIEVMTGSGRILIMDDDDMVREAITIMLEDMGYTVDSVDDGEKVLTRYRKQFQSDDPYKLVILDLTVPGGIGGKKVIHELLQFDPNANAILASGYSTDQTLLNYRDAGFRGIINKPINFEKLSHLIHRIISENNDSENSD